MKNKDQILAILKSGEKVSDEVLKEIDDYVLLRKLLRKEVLEEGHAYCPICKTKKVRYRRSLNRGMYFFLMHLSSKYHKGEWVHYNTIQKEVSGKYRSNVTDYSKLRIFNLIEMKGELNDETGVASGECRITNFGWDFLRGAAAIPKFVMMIDNIPVRFSDKKIFFSECQQKFRLKDIYDDGE